MKPHRDIEILDSSTSKAEVYIGKQVFPHSLHAAIACPWASMSLVRQLKDDVPMWFKK